MGWWDDMQARADGLIRQRMGETVRYAPGSGPPVDVTGVVGGAAALLAALPGARIDANTVGVWLKLADLPSNPKTDPPRITRYPDTAQAALYRGHEFVRDGAGTVVLVLHEATA